MAGRILLFAAFGALVTAMILVMQSGPLHVPAPGPVELRSTAAPWPEGHRAAQYWVMKPTDWNNRWWITCAVVFKTSYGVVQQSLFYSPIYAADDVDCMHTNLQRAHELAPFYRY
jgi:hypothetical protein